MFRCASFRIYTTTSCAAGTGAQFADCDLSVAVLAGAHLAQISIELSCAARNLMGADFSGASLLGADFRGANFADSRWRRAKLLGATTDPDALLGLDTFGAALGGVDSLSFCTQSAASAALCAAWWLLASGHDDQTIRLWDAGSGRELRRCEGHSDSVLSVAWNRDGRRLASASSEKTVRLWDSASGRCLAIFISTPEGSAGIRPDGRYKLVADPGGMFWHCAGLCRFEPGELDSVFPGLRLGIDEPL